MCLSIRIASSWNLPQELVAFLWCCRQVSARREREMTALRFAAEELENEKQAENDYDEFLRQEAQRLKAAAYQPKVGRMFLALASTAHFVVLCVIGAM